MVDSTFRHCFETASAAAGRQLTDDELDRLFTRLQGRMDRYVREGLSPQQAAQRAGTELGDEARAASAIAQRNAALNLQKRIARRQTVLGMAQAIGGNDRFAQALAGQISGGRNAPAFGNRMSAEAVWRTRQAEYRGALALALDRLGLRETFRKGTLDAAWARELYELSMRAAGEPDRVGITGSREALQMAEAIHGLQQLARQRLNREGAAIGDYAGYITRTAHDPDKMARAGFEAWRAFIEPRLSERTFEDAPDRAAYLRSTWYALVSGVHLSDREAVGLDDPKFTGPANLAQRISAGRKLHFQDATSWLQYQQAFGRGSLGEQVTGALDRAARQEAILRHFGTNPEAELANDIRWLQENQREQDAKAVRTLGQRRRRVQVRMDYLTGNANTPSNPTIANIGASIRAIESMAKLGGVAFTHLSAFPTKAAELRYHGVGWLQAYANSLGAILQGRGHGEQRELSDLLLAGIEGMHGHMLSQFHADDAAPGVMAKLANSFFRLSLLTLLLDAEKAGTARLMARWLGQHVDRPFAELPAQLQRTLQSYALSPDEWELLRNAPEHPQVDGRVHLTPDAAQRAMGPGDAADDLALKLRTLFADIADRGIITPGIEEKATFLRGTQPGSAVGEGLRFISQFKMWGAAAVRQGLGREINGGQGIGGATAGLFQLALGMTVMGYLTMTLKDLSKAKNPRDPLDPRTVAAAAIQGGGYGLLGDYMFGQFNRFGQTPVEAAVGPVAGTVGDLLLMYSTARGYLTGDPNARPTDLGPEMLRIAQNNTPFINLFYLRRILDYLLFHSLQESMNPGYLRRAEKSMQQRTGQTYILPPSTYHAHTFGR